MFFRKKKYPSGNIGVIIVEKFRGKFKELATIGITKDESEVGKLVEQGKIWINKELERRQPCLDLFGEERQKCEAELENVQQILSQVSNILLNGCDLILDRI